MWTNNLFHHRISQLVLPGKMMKQRTFGRACLIHNSVNTAALKASPIKFLKGSLQDSASGLFWCSSRNRFHNDKIQTSRYVVNANVPSFFTTPFIGGELLLRVETQPIPARTNADDRYRSFRIWF